MTTYGRLLRHTTTELIKMNRMLQFKFARALTQKHIKKSNLEQLQFH